MYQKYWNWRSQYTFSMEITVSNVHHKAQSPIQRKFSPYNTPETKYNDHTEQNYLSKKN